MAFKIEEFIKELKEMKVADLNTLVKAIEEEFGVSAAAPVAAAAPDAMGSSDEQTLTLVAAGSSKIAVIKIVREILGLGLMEAKKFVDSAPSVIKENISADEITELSAKFTEAGAEVKAE